MTDAALTLRRAIQGGQAITFLSETVPCDTLAAATHIAISGQSFPKGGVTRFRKLDAASAGDASYYTLDALYLAWALRDASAAEYTRQARENGVGVGAAVSVTARGRVLDWLEGRVDMDVDETASKPVDAPESPRKQAAELTKRRYVPDTIDSEAVKKIRKSEVELTDRRAVLRGVKINNFTAIRNVYTEKLKSMRVNAPTTATTPSAEATKPRKSKSNWPIIMVSSSPTALVTMYNVKRFLQDAVFETSQEAREKGNTEKLVTVDRKLTHIDTSGKEIVTKARYIVVDSHESLNRLGADAWERVVCVMTTGQAWQFKPYRWTEPRVLFHHVKGIHFSWASDPPNTKIKDWNVSELKIDPNRRHVDKAVVAGFWKLLDVWMASNKPGLVPK